MDHRASSRIVRCLGQLSLALTPNFLALVLGLLVLTPARAGSITREVFQDISGTLLSDLTNSPAYPSNPTFTEQISDFFEAPTDVLDNYGQRLHGYLVPPVTGNYRFWIASDDQGGLFLSTDEQPSNVRFIAQVPEWTASRQWDKYQEQQSQLISLQANKAYYISALMKEGGGGDNLAVRWLRPDGQDEAPIPATYLLPWGTAFTPPAITQQPTNTTAVEGQMATFVVKVSNIDPVSVRWKRNGGDVPNGDKLVLQYGPVTMADQNATFAAALTNRIGSTNTTVAKLTVLPDVTPPQLLSVVNLGAERLLVTFSEALDVASVGDTTHYSMSGGIQVTAAAMDADPRRVVLTITPLTFAQNYTLTVRGILDRAQTPNVVAPESSVTFLALELVSQGIGTTAGSIQRLGTGSFQVTGAGRGSSSTATSDELQFAWEQRTGNFDLRVRVDAMQVTDPYVQAGLMARANLGTNSPFAAVFTGSAQVGSYFQSRATAGVAPVEASPRGGFAFNGNLTWLRLQRSGNQLTGYGSYDGQTWTSLGTASVTLGSPVYVGLVASSRQPSVATSVRFVDYSTTPNPVLGPNVNPREPLGPTTRRTGLVISEIMYHPRPPTGVTNNLEFVELYNAGPIFEDLSGWQIRGGVHFTFPAGFKLEAGAFVVVAADPAALQTVASIGAVMGPFEGSLSNGGDGLRLHDSFGALKLEVNYSTKAPWPVAADGAGHSLILARPSYGSDDPRAWAVSDRVGGSPGAYDALTANPWRDVVINEFLAHTDDPQLDFIELFNRNKSEVALGGCILTDDPATNRFRIPAGVVIPGRGYLSYDQNQLGFRLSAAGETIYLLSPDGSRVLDAIRFGAQENGVASGRSPDGADRIRRLIQPTPSAGNATWRREAIVINEIMYKPISGDPDEEYVELMNRSEQPVDLAGWRFTDGISYEFGPKVILAPGTQLVVARNAARLKATHPDLNPSVVFGDFTGSLSGSGEHLALAMPDDVVSTNALGEVKTNHIHIVIAETTYNGGDRWHQWADGGGSSLELIDPNADPLEPSNWADSDESAKAPWTTIAFTGTMDNGNGTPDRFQISLLGAGECLVDDVEFFTPGGVNRLANPGFESVGGWTFAGNYYASRIQNGDAATGNRCLRVVAQGDGDTGPNCVRQNLTQVPSAGGQATIRGKARWLRGWPEILFRTRGNWIEAYGRLTVPSNLGTPGAPNSRLVANSGPVITEVQPKPILPADEPVTISARVSDPDGLAIVNLRFRVDPATAVTTVPMRDDGTGGDLVAGDGIYTATISRRSAGTMIAYRIEATDANANPVTRIFPPNYPDSECLIRWGEPSPGGSFAHYHLWTTTATEDARFNSYGLNNRYRDTTLVYGNSRVIYSAGFRDKGSPFHGGTGDFSVIVPKDELLLGSEDRVLALTGNGDNEETGMRGQVANWIASRLGIPHLHSHYIRLYRNGGQYATVMEDLEQPNNRFAEGFFPSVDQGDLYKIAVWFEFNDDDRGFSATGATTERFTSPGLGLKPARYRWNWQTRGWLGSANNLTNIYNLVNAANATTDYATKMQSVIDPEEWMRVFAFHRITGNWDSYTYGVGQNMYLYFQPGERGKLLPWDIDFVLGRGNGPAEPLGGGSLGGSNQDPVANAFYNEPAFRRYLFQAFLDAIEGPLTPEQYQPQLDARKSVLRSNGLRVGTGGDLADPNPIATYIDARREFLKKQLNAADRGFAITSNGGNNYTSTQPTTTLTGTAPFAVETIEVNGIPYPVKWTDVNTFSVVVPLTGVSNPLALVGKDRRGVAVPGATDSVTVTFNGAVPKPEELLVINEIQYDPVASGGSFVELYNRSQTTPFDLSGWVFQGLGYTFPTGAVLSPNSYLVLAKDRTAFALAYGNTVPVFDVFPGSLDNGGETLSLIRPGNTPAEDKVITDVRYDDDPPWPANAAGQGSSLQLIDPALRSWSPANWMATATNDVNRATPGRVNAGKASLPAVPAIWINEVLPNNVSGPVDNLNQRDPFIELYNSGTTSVDLSSYYLTDSYTNLTRWAFPSPTNLDPGQFLVVWADGQPEQATASILHTNFRLNPTNGAVALVRLQGSPSAPAVLDYVNYAQQPAGRSLGDYPDGDPHGRRSFYHATAGQPNDPTFPPVSVVINEFMASNTSTITNSFNGKKDDWFELYNAGTSAVDLTGYTLTDSLTNRTQFQIPPGFVLAPKGYLLVWADDETKANTNGSTQLHVNFKLAATGEDLALFAPDGALVDGFTFGAQTADISQGRFPDGASGPLVTFEEPTPGEGNNLAGGNRPPVFTPVPSQSVAEGATLQFKVTATDEPGQVIQYSVGTDAPVGLTVDEVTGVCSWKPTEAQGPGKYTFTIVARDNGTPVRSSGIAVTVTVTEQNLPPVFVGLVDRTVDERATLSFRIQADDSDLPANSVTYSLDGPVPDGLTLDGATGQVSWAPTEAQGPGSYLIKVKATDNGSPVGTAQGQFRITVNEVNNAPDIADIQPQTVDEGAPLSLQVVAADPDTPASAVTYSLEGALPDGIRIDANTGRITWTPDETQGPGNYIVVVRATEKNASALSAARSFGITVNEVNVAPTLQHIDDFTVEEGTELRFTAAATDPDRPSQKLTYSLIGTVPEGATIDGNTGEFYHPYPADLGAVTNTYTVQVSDNGPRALKASQSFKVRVTPKVRVVISEIMYRPTVANTEFIELRNASSVTTWDLSGYQLRGDNLSYTFEPGTLLAPGSFLCVARDSTAFRAAYGPTPRLAGVWTGTLGANGDYLRLVTPAPSSTSFSGVRYSASAPWPTAAAGGGASLQLVDDRRDPARVANWSGAPAYNGPRQLVVMTNLWRYYQVGPAAADWKAAEFDDSAWPQGRGLLYKEEADLPAPKSTLLTLGQNTYYFRTKIVLPSVPAGASLSLFNVIDDGAVFYLNGQELYRQNIAANAVVDFNTPATPNVSDATLLGPFKLPTDALRQGTNVFAVEVHQSGLASSDIVMGASLDLEGGNIPGLTPGGSNNVAATRTEFPKVWLNEVVPNNTAGLRDRVGEREPWIELVNTGDTEVALDGWSLTDSLNNLAQWKFPVGTKIAAGGFLVVFADGEPADASVDELHTNFRLAAASGSIVLARPVATGAEIADYIDYASMAANEAMASLPDGQPFQRSKTSNLTPGAANSPSVANRPPVFESWVAPTLDEGVAWTLTVKANEPDAGQSVTYSIVGSAPAGLTLGSSDGVLRWTPAEADGPGTFPITLRATDNGIPPRYDEKPMVLTVREVNLAPKVQIGSPQDAAVGQLFQFGVSATDADFPAQGLTFTLEGAPQGMTIDAKSGTVSWTPTAAQVGTVQCVVRVTDDGSPKLSGTANLSVTVQGGSIAVTPEIRPDGSLHLRWSSTQGVNYQIQMVSSLKAPWEVHTTVAGTGGVMDYAVPMNLAPPRFFRVLVP